MADETQENVQESKRTISAKQILGVIFLVVFVVFLIENNHKVTVRLLIPERSISLSLALLIAGILGAVGLLLLQRRRRHRS
jgi:uncharacterized integral membrane protein